MFFDDTITAPATTPGTGAVSIIRLSGSDAFTIADKVVKLRKGTISASAGYSLHFGKVFTEDGGLLDEVIVSVFRNPQSYTGEDSVEISCHASSYIVTEILRLLCDAGARLAEAGEFTKRAYVNGKMDLSQAESVADLIASEDKASHRVAMSQMRGGYSEKLDEIREQLLEMTALLELELDFSEEDVEFADRSKLISLVSKAIEHVTSLADSFRRGNAIKNGVPVAIAGDANTGKSTLLNALLGEDRAIVSDIAGTTRDTIEETLNIDGIKFRFIDTAGIRETDEVIESIGIGRAYKKISEAEIVLAMIDANDDFPKMKASLERILPRLDLKAQKLFVLLNKCDMMLDGGECGVVGGGVVNAGGEMVYGVAGGGADEGAYEGSDAVAGRVTGCGGDVVIAGSETVAGRDAEAAIGSTGRGVAGGGTEAIAGRETGCGVAGGDAAVIAGSETGCIIPPEEGHAAKAATASCATRTGTTAPGPENRTVYGYYDDSAYSAAIKDSANSEEGKSANGAAATMQCDAVSEWRLKSDSIAAGGRDSVDRTVISSRNSGRNCRNSHDNKNVIALYNFVSTIDKEAIIIKLSAKNGSGLQELKTQLAATQKDRIASTSDTILVTNLRHFNALAEARTSLLDVRSGLTSGIPSDLVAQDLRSAIDSIGSILGKSISVDETLGVIFERFCIGK